MARGHRSRGRRCLATGCGRSVRPGAALCGEHERGAAARELEAAVGRIARRVERAFAAGREGETEMERQRRAGAEFRRGLERGDYGGLFDGRLREVMAQAAAERGLAEEIGALRVVLARLLAAENEDPLRVAHGVARVAGVTVRAMAAQRALEDEFGGELGEALQEALANLEKLDAEEAARAEQERTGGAPRAAEWPGVETPG